MLWRWILALLAAAGVPGTSFAGVSGSSSTRVTGSSSTRVTGTSSGRVSGTSSTRVASARTVRPGHPAGLLQVPASADQLIVLASPTDDPPAPGYLATLQTYQRTSATAPWRAVFPVWQAETGSGHLLPAADRREGDHATPIGVFGIGATMYGTEPNPGGLHYTYHQLVCGDWWDEDPYSQRYSQFVHVPCAVTPGFAAWSEALWTEGNAYPYLAVIDFNTGPIVSGAAALGAGIFLHSWMGTATEGCVALPEGELLDVLRWLRPSQHPVIEIGLDSQVDPIPAAPGGARGASRLS
ncbi:MAG: L,D-transpeptidase family protein [Solirubrobacteraceae bacterium]